MWMRCKIQFMDWMQAKGQTNFVIMKMINGRCRLVQKAQIHTNDIIIRRREK